MAGEKAEKAATNEKKPKAKGGDNGDKVKKGMMNTPRKGKPHNTQNFVLVRGAGKYS